MDREITDEEIERTIITVDVDSELDLRARAKLARRIVEYREHFRADFEHDNWNSFELDFLDSMEDKVDCYGDLLLLTRKQEVVLKRIISKYDIP